MKDRYLSSDRKNKKTDSKKLPIWIILAILLLPFAVLLLAGYALFNHSFDNLSSTNLGNLINPMLSVEALDARISNDSWQMVVLIDRHCDAACSERLATVRNAHWALGRQAHRVRRAVIILGGQLDNQLDSRIRSQFPDMEIFHESANKFYQWLGANPAISKPYHLGVMVVDPLGNAFIYYDQHHSGNNMIIDLRKLLRFSSLG